MISCSRPARSVVGRAKYRCLRTTAIAAFLDQSLGRDVAGEIVAVGVDPESLRIEFALESQRIIDTHFTGQEHHQQAVAEGESLNRVIDRLEQFFAPVESCELSLAL